MAALLLALPLPAQAPAGTAPTTGTGAPSSTVAPDSPSVARPGPSTAARAAAARADSIARIEAERNAKDGGWGAFPKPVGLAVLVIVLLGALGALAGDLVADGTRLDRWRSDETGWVLGFPGRLLIGVVVALIVVMGLNPPNGSWPVLISTALAVGAASEAILLAVMASWKARVAETETRRVRNAAVEKIEGMRVSMHALHAAAAGQGPAGAQAAPRPVDSRASAGLAAQVDRLAEQAKAELLADIGHPAAASAAHRGIPHFASEVSMRDAFDQPAFDAADRGVREFGLEDAGTEVVIVYEVPESDFSRLSVDDVELAPDADGVHRVFVGPGQHVIHCEGQTRPDAEYKIEITDPEEARPQVTSPQRAAPSGIINDFFPFTTNG